MAWHTSKFCVIRTVTSSSVLMHAAVRNAMPTSKVSLGRASLEDSAAQPRDVVHNTFARESCSLRVRNFGRNGFANCIFAKLKTRKNLALYSMYHVHTHILIT